MRSLLDTTARFALLAPDGVDGGGAAGSDASGAASGGADHGGGEGSDAGGSGDRHADTASSRGERRGKTVRESIQETIDQLGQADPVARAHERDSRGRDASGRFVPGAAGAAQGGTESGAGAAADAQGTDTAAGADGASGATATQPPGPPDAWSKEAKALWPNLPPEIQQAAIKREADVKAGVDKLKAQIDAHKEIDKAIEPHLQEIQQAGVTPAVGIARLMEWHRDIRRNPAGGLAQLMRVFGLDPTKPLLMPRGGAGADGAANGAGSAGAINGAPAGGTQNGAGAAAATPEVPAELKPLLDAIRPIIEASSKPLADQLKQVTDRITGFERETQRQSQKATENIVMKWGAEKPHFNDVREIMTEILIGAAQTNKAHRYMDPQGNVDLDKLYDAAVHMHPEVRAKVLAEQAAAAEAKRQADAKAAEAKAKADAEKARTDAARAARAGVGLRPGAPGTQQGAGAGRKPGQKREPKSVRESINEAIETVRESGRV
jgi:hypothetical protein